MKEKKEERKKKKKIPTQLNGGKGLVFEGGGGGESFMLGVERLDCDGKISPGAWQLGYKATLMLYKGGWE